MVSPRACGTKCVNIWRYETFNNNSIGYRRVAARCGLPR